MKQTKPFWKSKTFWVNLLPLAAAVLKLVGLVPPEAAELADSIASPEMLTLAVGNLGLRTVTEKPLSVRS